jgi:hypothetical protein
MANFLHSEPRWIKINNCSLTVTAKTMTGRRHPTVAHNTTHGTGRQQQQTAQRRQQHNSKQQQHAQTIVDMLENTGCLKTRRRYYIYTHSQTLLITTVV